ncbi:hypothetical protein M404DRAFT_151262, partial [Pisolithus tinctorius Marx 270]
GEIESTMLHSYLKGARLCAWLSHTDCPPAIRECKILLDRVYRQDDACDFDTDGLVSPQADNLGTMNVPHDLWELVGQRKVVLCANVKHSTGVYYSRLSSHVGNSLILFYPGGNRSLPPVPGSIKYIYQSGDSFVFAVQRQHPLTAGKKESMDPFAQYPHFPAKLYSSTLEETLESIRCSWVSGHYARWAVSSDTAVVLSLCRVRSL